METSSFLLFNVLSSGWQIIKNFSCNKQLHRFVLSEYVLQCCKIFQLIDHCTIECQISLLSSTKVLSTLLNVVLFILLVYFTSLIYY